ncbi:cysteine methyltransferase [Arthrobacter sp. MYb211]|uniref:MGMT family protein n=1 Tax=Micrococcaceae TaxID=1268 RepID=UPI000CFE3437|nr:MULTISPECIES: MGMT family protein [unclassified Arthrobacter]PRA12788.1 cysteine methyltransferase [Arthrobacter sp. MYb221]PRC09692.1 cysteine methyltransferase [Arthrobacter sp. MYb211]
MSSESSHLPLEYAEAVHRLAALVPPGAVLSYGDVAELLGVGGARQAGKAMGSSPEGTPWWRILRADGTLTLALGERGEDEWTRENTPRRGRRVNMAQARWKPNDAQWAQIDSLKAALQPGYLSEADDQL